MGKLDPAGQSHISKVSDLRVTVFTSLGSVAWSHNYTHTTQTNKQTNKWISHDKQTQMITMPISD